MSLSIAFLLALMLPAQAGSQTQDQSQLGSGPAPLYQSLQHQNQTQPKPFLLVPFAQSSSQSPSSDWLGPLPQVRQPLRQLQQRRMTPEDFMAEQNSHMCLSLRVYHFERNDGKAPVLVKTLTCTPNTVLLKRAGPPPKGLYVPLKLNY